MPRSTDGGTSGDEAASPRAASVTRPKKSKSTTTTSCPSPTSSSSSDFEFTVSLSPTSKRPAAAQLCPADELFYKGQLLPLHLSPRISMVRSLLLSSASTSSASGDSSATSRDSNGSTSSSFSADLHLLHPSESASSSSRPSSVTEEEALSRRSIPFPLPPKPQRSTKYLSSLANRFSSVFLPRGNSTKNSKDVSSGGTGKMKPSPKEVLKKYVKKVKPLYEKLSSLPQKQHSQNQPQPQKRNFSFSIRKDPARDEAKSRDSKRDFLYDHHSNSFSGNLKYPRRKRCAASCPSSMRSSPSHSGLLSFGGGGPGAFPDVPMQGPVSLSTASSMEELQSAIEGAIAHCKSSLGAQKKVAIGSRSFEFDGESFVDCGLNV
ncbi:hypothetical protein LUZ61_017186 [Rhynchospora tenuis]|uniref:Membrane-associated kinase regulator 1 n=1 Tax=Rhynchospora tenuis TaxID=198213 RepID=A0AAD6EKR0_9POAL|nr:hypothetical protein LUZ61_017186 [Rhynchospora tenuis]